VASDRQVSFVGRMITKWLRRITWTGSFPFLAGIGAWATLWLIPPELQPPNRGLILAFLFGALLGMAEIVSRYRDEPIQALVTRYGMLYWFLNGMLGIWAFLIVWRFPAKFSLGFEPRSSAFLTAVLAGFGGAAVMRARLVTLKDSSGKDLTIGPDVVIKTLLEVVDLQIDRKRAGERWAFVETHFGDALKVYQNFGGDFKRMADALQAALYSFQNLSDARRQDLAAVLKDYAERTEIPDIVRLLAVCFVLLTVAGEQNFVGVLKFYTRPDPPSSGA